MKRGKFEKILSRRLRGYQENPSAEVWDSICRDLQGIVPQATSVLKSSGNRRRQVKLYSYAAAACVIAVLYLVLDVHNDVQFNSSGMADIVNRANEGCLPSREGEHLQPSPEVGKIETERLSILAMTDPVTEEDTEEQIMPRTGDPTEDSENKTGDAEPIVSEKEDDYGKLLREKYASTDLVIDPRVTSFNYFQSKDRSRSTGNNRGVMLSFYAGNLSNVGKKEIQQRDHFSGTYAGIFNNPGNDESNGKDIESVTTFKHRMPLQIGMNLSFKVAKKLSLETGLSYTFLFSKSSKGNDLDVQQKLHYIGVPVMVKYDFVSAKRYDFYVNGGGMIEKCLSAHRKYTSYKDGSRRYDKEENFNVSGVQPSINANIGFELKFNELVGLYVEPGINYYFSMATQPASYRTDNAVSFSVKAGIRFSLN